MNSLITFSGHKGSGKSHCSTFLVKTRNYTKENFAGPLKSTVSHIFDLSDECYDESKKEQILTQWNTTPRKLLQVIGTDLFRTQLIKYIPELTIPRNSIWGSILYNKILIYRQRNPNRKITIDDVRFNDEYHCIKDLKGIVIRIERPSKKHNKISTIKSYITYCIPNQIKTYFTYFTHFTNYIPRFFNSKPHITEQGCLFDYLIINDGTLYELECKLLKLVEKLT
jgi:hypothetical protein